MLKYPSSRTEPAGSSWRNAARRDPLALLPGYRLLGARRLPFLSIRRELGKECTSRALPEHPRLHIPRRSCLTRRHHRSLGAGTTLGAVRAQQVARPSACRLHGQPTLLRRRQRHACVILVRSSTENSKPKNQSHLLRRALATKCRKPYKTFLSHSLSLEITYARFINTTNYTNAKKGTHFQRKLRYQLSSHLLRKVSTSGEITKINQIN